MPRYHVMARVTVDINRLISADSLEQAVDVSKKLTESHFVQPAKGADSCFNDFRDFEVYGIFADD